MESQEIKRALKIKEVVQVLERIGYSADDKIVCTADNRGQDVGEAEQVYGVVTVATVLAAGLVPSVYALTESRGIYRVEVNDFPLGVVTAIITEGSADDIKVGQVGSLFDFKRIDVSNIPLPILDSITFKKARQQDAPAPKPAPINYQIENENGGQVWRNYKAVMSGEALLEVCGLEFWAAIRAAIETGEMVGFSVEFADHRVLIERVG